MFVRVENTARDLGGRFDVATRTLEQVTADIAGRFDASREQFSNILDGTSSRIIAELNTTSATFADGLEESTAVITGRFEQTAGALVERIDHAARQLETRGESTSLRLDEAGTKFAGSIEQASALLDERLTQAGKGLNTELEDVLLALSARLESTSGMVGNRLEEASEAVERAVESFNTGMEHVIHNREERLNGLVAELGARTSDVDAMMAKYTVLIEEALNRAHGRTQDLARVLADQVGQTSEQLQGELRRIEEAADHHVSAAAKTMREQYENVLASMGEMLAASNQNFGQTAQEMQATAKLVVQDIAHARTELRRTILDLPDETRANADAMRQVVSDQITALMALSDVVKRQSGLMEMSGPGVVPPANGGRSRAKSEGAPTPAPQQSATAGDQETLVAEAAAESRTDDRLSQLSIDEAHPAALARKTEKLVSKLNAVARDLVHGLDGKLDEELERRFNAGEEHVYTHRLYLARSKLQAEIETRYAEEQLIRGRSDAFVRLFERLLERVAESPQGQELVAACLGSESGKVYAMLAQASGRKAAE